MKRRCYILASALSLLLCVATVALWIRGYWTGDSLGWNDVGRKTNRELYSAHGRFVYCASDDLYFKNPTESQTFDPRHNDLWDWVGTFGDHQYCIYRLGIISFAKFSEGSAGIRYQIISVPCWAAAMVFLVCPGCLAWQRLRCNRTAVSGACSSCGYDLRATPERCPECGTVCRAPRPSPCPVR